mmetsp:Transcript_37311/g.75588  ORF Transcript_37311/g.75588 Transcript_37311/m.75588 type:complete len:320 (+) Transcript_37311:169-1128(+)
MSGSKVHLGPPFERGDSKNGWLPADATEFPVRGKNYLKDKKKTASQPSAFRLAGVHGFTAAQKIPFVTASPYLASMERTVRSNGSVPFLFVMHFDISPQHLVLAFELDEAVLSQDSAFANVWKHFLEGDDAYKSERIKLITSMVEASWVVRRAVGKPVPALLGNKLPCTWRQTDSVLECTCDVSASMVARVILGVVRGACRDIVCDLILLIESRQTDELPERIIGGARVFRMDMPTFPPVGDGSSELLSQPPEEVPEEHVEEMLQQRDPDEVYTEGEVEESAANGESPAKKEEGKEEEKARGGSDKKGAEKGAKQKQKD